MGELECIICKATKEETEHMVGVEFNHEDHGDREDVALCDSCITEAYNILQKLKFRKTLQEEIINLQRKE